MMTEAGKRLLWMLDAKGVRVFDARLTERIVQTFVPLIEAEARDLVPGDNPEYMCPNCVTPWKCNGPHIAETTS